MNSQHNYLRATSDAFVGKRLEIERYLVVSLAGYFPVLAERDNALAIVYRTEAPHLGITGTLSVSISNDEGICWSDPYRVTPRFEDARNPGLGWASDGTLVLAYWSARSHAYELKDQRWEWSPADEKTIGDTPGLVIRRSTDGGGSFSRPEYMLSQLFFTTSPYGRIIELSDGDLLLSYYGRLRGRETKTLGCATMRSSDSGKTWKEERLIAEGFNETAITELSDGVLLAASRSQEKRNISIFSSNDGGIEWEQIGEVTRKDEHPADLTLLDDGRVLLTFGRRIRPFGCGALVSNDAGKTWNREREALLSGDGAENTDLGYPSTVQMADGTLRTALYYASGNAMSDDGHNDWGRVSCQVLKYNVDLFD